MPELLGDTSHESAPGGHLLTVPLGVFDTHTIRGPDEQAPAHRTLCVAIPATYLVADAFRDDADTFVAVTNDSVLMTPVHLVKHDLGKLIGILSP
jgi:hypothetical protein